MVSPPEIGMCDHKISQHQQAIWLAKILKVLELIINNQLVGRRVLLLILRKKNRKISVTALPVTSYKCTVSPDTAQPRDQQWR